MCSLYLMTQQQLQTTPNTTRMHILHDKLPNSPVERNQERKKLQVLYETIIHEVASII